MALWGAPIFGSTQLVSSEARPIYSDSNDILIFRITRHYDHFLSLFPIVVECLRISYLSWLFVVQTSTFPGDFMLQDFSAKHSWKYEGSTGVHGISARHPPWQRRGQWTEVCSSIGSLAQRRGLAKLCLKSQELDVIYPYLSTLFHAGSSEWRSFKHKHMGMDQNLLSFLVGWTSINPSFFGLH